LISEGFTFSQSSLQSYLNCPRQFELRYLQKLAWPGQKYTDAEKYELDLAADNKFYHMKSLTYKQIQSEYFRLYGKPVIQNCWIADVKRELGLTKRISHNRIDKNSAVKPCPSGPIRDRLKKIILSV